MREDLKPLARRMVEIDYQHKHGHLASCCSALPIIADIYAKMDRERDIFILSKGHACAAWYAVLEKYGYRPDVSKVHPDIDPAAGIPCTTGSLGHGLPMAVGMALANSRHTDCVYPTGGGTVHVLLGDGECQEGTTWESLIIASRLIPCGLNLRIHIDNNFYQGDMRTPQPSTMLDAMEVLYRIRSYGIPKGSGITLFEKHPDWHVHFLTEPEYREIMEELK